MSDALPVKDIIYLEDISVQFGDFKALDNVIFFMSPGELRFLIGPNGAGKTTLLDVICRKVKESSGRIFFEEKDFLHSRIHTVARMGISRKFQAPSVFPSLTVRENMELAYPRARGLWHALSCRFTSGEKREIEDILKKVNLDGKRDELASGLSHGQTQWLEIALTLIQKPKLLLVDEPVAGMTREERTRTGHILRDIAAHTSVLVVEHDMKFVEEFAQKVTVLHEGRILCEGTFAEISKDPRVLSVYLGRGE
ncbi:MAG: urea ABC transporter ATP-binding protein UrtD [Spirochaetales bacterium]|jgi:urea transport system ATP-binding protein|nr:urea ABC transporter ATP-binding protein UrtD [Spirochaetales bacterium]